MDPETTVSSQLEFAGRILRLRVDEVELPNGRQTRREVVEHPGAVAILPIAPDGELLLVRQYRHAVGQTLLEIPAGTREVGEDVETCVRRECAEETGYAPGQIEKVGGFFSTPGFSTEWLDLYLATHLVAVASGPAEDEAIELAKMPLGQAIACIRGGEIRDAKSIAGILTLRLLQTEDPRG